MSEEAGAAGAAQRGETSDGGQRGHKGRTLRQVGKPARVRVHQPERCAVCGRGSAAEESDEVVSRRQVFDLPEPKMEVTEHRLGSIVCYGQPGAIRTRRADLGGQSVGRSQAVVGANLLPVQRSVRVRIERRNGGKGAGRGIRIGGATGSKDEGAVAAGRGDSFRRGWLAGGGELPWLHTASNALCTHLLVYEKASLRSCLSSPTGRFTITWRPTTRSPRPNRRPATRTSCVNCKG